MDSLLAAPDRQTPQGQRDYALLLFLYNSGTRADEAAQLIVRDLHTDALFVRIVGKGVKSATVHTTACHLLRAGVDINTIRSWLGHVSLDTTNIYAEMDLEMKAKALAMCEVAGEPKTNRPWRRDPPLMTFFAHFRQSLMWRRAGSGYHRIKVLSAWRHISGKTT
jgi:site-specific recombinase XerC